MHDITFFETKQNLAQASKNLDAFMFILMPPFASRKRENYRIIIKMTEDLFQVLHCTCLSY